ncbi:MAG: hypothetical protein PHO15_00350 [Eubacteriales bacterium]|nr:hypothetical protein [Eubacteriales bacterium]
MDKALLIEYAFKHWGDDAKIVLTSFPLTGPGGLRRMLGEIYPEYFCKAYMPDQFEREFADYSRIILNTLKETIESKSREKRVIIAPREHGKSTFSSFAIPTWAALYKKKRFIFFISSSSGISSNFFEKIKRTLESDSVIEDFGNQKNTKGNWLTTWNKEELKTVGDVWISYSGWTSGLRGINKDTRPDLIILDDLEDKSVAESASLRQKLETCFNEEIGRLGTYNTDFFYIGTLLYENSLLDRVSRSPSWKALILKRVISFPDSDGEKLWEEWRKIYRNIANENRFDDAWKFYTDNKDKMLNGTKVLWEDKVPADKTKYPGGYYNVMLAREEFGEDAFWKEDQSEPRESSDMPFKTLSFWQDIFGDCPALPSTKLAIDPSEGKGLDSTAYVVGGGTNGAVIIKNGELRNDKLNAIMSHSKELIKNMPEIDEVIIEENTYKEDGTEQLRKYLSENNCYRKVTGFRSTDNKHNRIISMEPDINNGTILFNKLNASFNKEVLHYSESSKHDDAPDVTHKLWKTLKKPNYFMA